MWAEAARGDDGRDHRGRDRARVPHGGHHQTHTLQRFWPCQSLIAGDVCREPEPTSFPQQKFVVSAADSS